MGRKPGNRAKALAKGVSTYIGAPCPDCGHKLRRTTDWHCVHCLEMDDGRTNTQAHRTWPYYKERRAEYERNRRALAKSRNTALALYLSALAPIERPNPRKDKTMVAPCPNKANAKKAGRKTYDAPYQCEACSTTRRYTHSGNCVECARIAAKDYRKGERAQQANRERQARFRARKLAEKVAKEKALFDDI